MAKRVKPKTKNSKIPKYETEYKRQRKNYLRRLKTLKEKGIFVEEINLPTFKQLKEQGYTVKQFNDLSKQISTKKQLQLLEKKTDVFDVETGEIYEQFNPETGEKTYDYTEVSVIEKIREELRKLTGVGFLRGGIKKNLDEAQNTLINILDERLYSTPDNEYYDLIHFYDSNFSIVTKAVDDLMNASDSDEYASAWSWLVDYLNGGDEAPYETMSNVNDYNERTFG